MISNGAKTTRYKINLTKKFESGSDRWQIAVEQAGRVVDPIVDSCGVWQIAVEQTVE